MGDGPEERHRQKAMQNEKNDDHRCMLSPTAAAASLSRAGRSRYSILDDGVLFDAVVIVPSNCCLRFFAGLQRELQKTADRFFVRVRLLDEALRIVAERISRRPTKPRVFVDDRTGRKFFEAARIDRVVL